MPLFSGEKSNTTNCYLFIIIVNLKHEPFIPVSALSSWTYLEVTTSSRYNDSLQAYAAGAVEAAVTSLVSSSLLFWWNLNLIECIFFRLKKVNSYSLLYSLIIPGILLKNTCLYA